MALVDQFGRQADYLRIAVTDRCNLRCRYCMPASGIDWVPREKLLSYDEILRLAHIFKNEGVKKLRITGGEPFVRRDMSKLIHSLYDIFDQVHITTNATLIEEHLSLLSHPHFKGLNISLDSLEAENFEKITRRKGLKIVLKNIYSCLDLGIPVKINMVVMRGINAHEIPAFLDFSRETNISVRFIEAMPFNELDGNRLQYISCNEIVEIIESQSGDVSKVEDMPNSASMSYLLNNEIPFGIIPAYSRLLCGTCNRIRLTSKGEMLTCLYSKNGLNLNEALRNEANMDSDIAALIRSAVMDKKVNGHVEEELRKEEVFQSMTSIGG